MVSPRKQQSHEPINLDEAFCRGAAAEERITPTPIPTGLNNEEDAARHLALRFNKSLLFCGNCEVTYDIDQERQPWCPYCGDFWREVGSYARRKKRPTR